jgi:hypothetical protein
MYNHLIHPNRNMVNNHLVLLDLNRNDYVYIDYIDHLQHCICKYNDRHVPYVYPMDHNLFKDRNQLIIFVSFKMIRIQTSNSSNRTGWNRTGWNQLAIVGCTNTSISLITCSTIFTIVTNSIMLTVLKNIMIIQLHIYICIYDILDIVHLVHRKMNDHYNYMLVHMVVVVDDRLLLKKKQMFM